MRLRDPKNGYSWLSIALHWITAIVILTLWFIGSSINADREAGSLDTLYLHTSIAISAYALLWGRIIWRFWLKHPGPIASQAGIFYEIGKYTHYLIIAAVAAMLLSGPTMVWSRGDAIHVWDWFTIPGPFSASMTLFGIAHTIHVWGSRIVIIGTILHIGGVYKHAAFNQDGTFSKMLIATRDET
jgi:cytochrome b561